MPSPLSCLLSLNGLHANSHTLLANANVEPLNNYKGLFCSFPFAAHLCKCILLMLTCDWLVPASVSEVALLHCLATLPLTCWDKPLALLMLTQGTCTLLCSKAGLETSGSEASLQVVLHVTLGEGSSAPLFDPLFQRQPFWMHLQVHCPQLGSTTSEGVVPHHHHHAHGAGQLDSEAEQACRCSLPTHHLPYMHGGEQYFQPVCGHTGRQPTQTAQGELPCALPAPAPACMCLLRCSYSNHGGVQQCSNVSECHSIACASALVELVAV